jgi:hypothetical protein
MDVVGPSFAQKDIVSLPMKPQLVAGGDARKVSGAVLAGLHFIISGGVPTPPPIDLNSLHAVRQFGDLTSPVSLDLKPGYYLLVITGEWPQGTREFYFEIQIESPPLSVSPVLGCPFASQQPVQASTATGTTTQTVLRGWAGYKPGDRFKPAAGVPDSWWVERSGALVAWLRLASPPAATDPAEWAIIDGQMCSGGP